MDRRVDEQYIFQNIFSLTNKIQLAGDSYFDDLTMKQFLLLLIIKTWNTGVPNMNDLALMMGCTRQNIRKMITSLSKKEYIRCRKNKSDKRAVTIKLTDKGIETVSEKFGKVDNILDALFVNIEDDEVKMLCRIIDKLIENSTDILAEEL